MQGYGAVSAVRRARAEGAMSIGRGRPQQSRRSHAVCGTWLRRERRL
jgi:hypothetical protein